ncbi:VOC family protein [Agrobacterium pusense]|uniref:VOC family protein n=1 Tax=Agrobacterium pusense TaxID=648995 RepID=UPI0010BEAD66|nr:VOC family protein [Agrobacterium pusense]MDH0115624.1 VOC family protein [Agrobacterium pusense]QCL86733.1 VOC family protein [Agrobacterium pusense]
MTLTTTPHLNFRGDARAALEFYQIVTGGDITIVTHAQAYGTIGPAEADLVSWGQVSTPSGFHVMAYDVPSAIAHNPGEIPFFVSVRGSDVSEIQAMWDGLSIGATIVAPIGASPWSLLYGMLKDRFGVTWVLDVLADHTPY